ncbi:MAG: TonB-dependent receptor domain-containing protein [Terriglobales bacterium]
MISRGKLILILCALLSLCAVSTLAQQATGIISGTVTDQQGLAIAGAKVTIKNVDTKFTQIFTTAGDGIFRFPAVPIGKYAVTIAKDRFKTIERTGITLTQYAEVPVHVSMQVGAVTEQILVTGEAPIVDTEAAAAKQTFGANEIIRHDVSTLIATLPTNTGGSIATWLTFNGGRTEFNRWGLDGAQNQEALNRTEGALPDVEGIQEVNVVSTLAKAEQGQSSAQINVVTKSGTDTFHGHVNMPLPNRMNQVARSFFQARFRDPLGRPMDPKSKGISYYSASIGGPVILPTIYNGSGKTFFFFLYGGQHSEGSPAITISNMGIVPSQAFRNGDLSTLLTGAVKTYIRDPQTGAPFPNNQIPSDRIHPLAKKVMNTFFPLPNMPDGQNYFLDTHTTTDLHQYMAKIDHQVGQAHQMSFNVNQLLSNYELPSGPIVQFRNVSRLSQVHFGLSDIYTITPRVVNEFRMMAYRNHNRLDPVNYYDPNEFGFTGIHAATKAFPYIAITGYAPIGYTSQFEEITNNFEVKDDFSITRGKHGIKLGFDYVWNQGVQNNNILTSGYFMFTGYGASSGLCSAPVYWCSGHPFADFLLGSPYIYTQYSPAQSDIRYTAINAYVQDDWKVGRRVTLNLGLRWEGNSAPADAQNRMSAYRPGMTSVRFPNAPAGIVFQGDPGVPEGTVGNSYTNFAPRLGLAWDVTGSGKTVVHLGYGIYYQTNPLRQPIIGSVSQPFTLSVTLLPTLINPPPDPFTNPFGTDKNPFPYSRTASEATFYTPYNITGLAEGYTTPYTQQFSLNVQRELFSPNYVLTIGYIGSLGVHLQGLNEYNAAKSAADASPLNVQQRRPNQNFSSIRLYDTSQRSYYHSMVVSFNKRMSHGLQYSANYTWSKNIDTQSLNYSPPPQDPYNPHERALSALDVRHKFSGSWLYDLPDLPFLKRGSLAKRLLGGWQYNGLFQIQSGSPTNITTGGNNSFNGVYSDRPNLVGDWRIHESRSNVEKVDVGYFDQTAFEVNADGTFGNLPRNAVIGPGYVRFDMGVVKKFPVTDVKRFEFEARAVNIFNRPNFYFTAFAPSMASGNFGKLPYVLDGRVVSFIGKFYF